MRSERNGSSGKQSCSGGRARSCGGWMQRKRCGGARSYGSGSEEVAAVAVQGVGAEVMKELRQWR
ncbi:hypothetical protein F2Q70_00005200 [Brassica cretica]|uniref:Uncharacterized protein n=1 Tax=Brassica cretica TaxID=69181 RepID=A0A8S9J0E1_BRACR|nr:hypothetical protein F2Q68_00021830 [Brassica cretica]KAF2574992.1 hypothetical protein F2Q70_00005200 [Brassica cretica]